MSIAPSARQVAPRSRRRASLRLGLPLALAASAVCHLGAGASAVAADRNTAASSSPKLAVPGAVIPGFRRREWMTDPLEMFRLYSARGLIDPALTLESLRPGSAAAVQPITARHVDPLARRQLASAFPLALQRLDESPSCRALYERLGTDGLLVLSTTVYLSPVSTEAERLCGAHDAVAYTRTAQQTTIICPTFARLPRSRAAVTLLHEALHYAGLPERPADPAALSTLEISALVQDRCGL